MALLDVNGLVALAWDSHIHHARMREWFTANAAQGWATCPIVESGFVRVSSNAKALPHAVTVSDARRVLAALRNVAGHQFVSNDVSLCDPDVPVIHGYRQVTDVVLLVVARRHGIRLVTFDRGLAEIDTTGDVDLLTV